MRLNINIINKSKSKSKSKSTYFKSVPLLRSNMTNKTKSAICVVEDNGEDCVGHHDKKGDEGQDPSF